MATYQKLEPAPIRDSLIEDKEHMNLTSSWGRWLGKLASHINSGIRHMDGTPVYANNAAAIAAGLNIGDIYRTGDAMKIVH